MRKTCEKKGYPSGKFFLALILVIISFLPDRITAGQREILLEEEYLTEAEKEAIRLQEKTLEWRDRIFLDFELGFGLSRYDGYASVYGISDELQSYLDELEISYSENILAGSLTCYYAVNRQTTIYGVFPFGLVDTTVADLSHTAFENIKLGIGDISIGISSGVIEELERRPEVKTSLELNMPSGGYYSLGEGLVSLKPAVQLKKSISKSIYITATPSYTYRMRKDGVDPGEVMTISGGPGFIRENHIMEATVGRSWIGKTKLNGNTLFKFSDDLRFTLVCRSRISEGRLKGKYSTIYVTLGNLYEGFDTKKNTLGFGVLVPIW